MELVWIFKELAGYGITVPTIIGLRILYQINAKFACHDKRISILEVLQKRRAED